MENLVIHPDEKERIQCNISDHTLRVSSCNQTRPSLPHVFMKCYRIILYFGIAVTGRYPPVY